ncbi:hypothetical protein PMIN01_11926 [Paraphaeosphaeria minitans]|uniref:Uncharacterized protein n=1 Tax=Paraphaeosphaeria minitans TaxID=565426 RepID=A0A9P6G779_9PLEO|nr:hypothetical protein PMIN01_11926 [Paraphaeosphaeria minitans]
MPTRASDSYVLLSPNHSTHPVGFSMALRMTSMNMHTATTLEDHFPGEIQMDFAARTGKHSFSPLSAISPRSRKRMRISRDKPELRVDCTVSPRLPPQPISYLSPLQFPLDPTVAPNRSLQYTSALYQQQSCIQQPMTSQDWANCTGNFTPMWAPSTLPYSVRPNFMETCQTSAASYSVYSSISAIQNPIISPSEAVGVGGQSSLESQTEDVRDSFISASLSRLTRLKETLAIEQRAVEDLLEVAALLIGYGRGAENRV